MSVTTGTVNEIVANTDPKNRPLPAEPDYSVPPSAHPVLPAREFNSAHCETGKGDRCSMLVSNAQRAGIHFATARPQLNE